MKRTGFILIVLTLLAGVLTSCFRIAPQTSVETTLSTTTSETTLDLPVDPADVGLIDINSIMTTIPVEVLGYDQLDHDNCEISPSGQKFFLTENNADGTKNISGLNLSDQTQQKIGSSLAITNEFLFLSWSADENTLVFENENQMFVYQWAENRLTTLPVSGNSSVISPDGKKICYVDLKGLISVYDLISKTSHPLSGDIQGIHPAWFSDSQRIVFAASSEPNALDEYDNEAVVPTEIYEIKIDQPGKLTLLHKADANHYLYWLIRDRYLYLGSEVENGDGYQTLTVDMETKEVFGWDWVYTDHQICQNELVYICFMGYSDSPLSVYDSHFNDLADFYPYIVEGESWIYDSILLTANRLIYYLYDSPDQKLNLRMITGTGSDQTITQLCSLEMANDQMWDFTTLDGLKTILVDYEANCIRVIDHTSLVDLALPVQ